jgi:hypothetical protein
MLWLHIRHNVVGGEMVKDFRIEAMTCFQRAPKLVLIPLHVK